MKEDAIVKMLDHKISFEEMSNFGTKVGHDDDADIDAEPVDNPKTEEATGSIIKIDENNSR
jgi:hypothetical protein